MMVRMGKRCETDCIIRGILYTCIFETQLKHLQWDLPKLPLVTARHNEFHGS